MINAYVEEAIGRFLDAVDDMDPDEIRYHGNHVAKAMEDQISCLRGDELAAWEAGGGEALRKYYRGIDKVKKQPPDLTAGEFNRSE